MNAAIEEELLPDVGDTEDPEVGWLSCDLVVFACLAVDVCLVVHVAGVLGHQSGEGVRCHTRIHGPDCFYAAKEINTVCV